MLRPILIDSTPSDDLRKLFSALACLSIGCAALLPFSAYAISCYGANIKTPVPFRGNQGEVLTLNDDSKWRVKKGNLYLNAFYSPVLICPSEEQLRINSLSVSVERLGSRRERTPKPTGLPKARVILKAHIDGDFKGWSGNTFFRLDNGQVWQQQDYAVGYLNQHQPAITIFMRGKIVEMQIENLPQRIPVKRIQ